MHLEQHPFGKRAMSRASLYRLPYIFVQFSLNVRVVLAALVERGFRFFFLAAGIEAIVTLAWWVAVLALPALPLPATFSLPSVWHGHEMLFGFGCAVVAGFLLTAVPNWTGTAAATGQPVAFLAVLWLLGRATIWSGGALPVGLVALANLAFLPVLAGLTALPILRRRQWHNFAFPLLLSVLWVSQGLVHAGRIGLGKGMLSDPDLLFIGQHLALAAIILMIIIVGGRIVPNFTANRLRTSGGVRAAPRLVEGGVFVFSAVALVADLSPLPFWDVTAGLAAAVAAFLHAVRLSGWRSRAILGEPILWVLHLGYAWLVVAFALKAVALLTSWVTPTTAMHAFAAGVIGTMTLAVMTRAVLGHSGYPLVADRLTVLIYGLVIAGSIMRVIAPNLPAFGDVTLWTAGILWILAYALFVGRFLPLLTGWRNLS